MKLCIEKLYLVHQKVIESQEMIPCVNFMLWNHALDHVYIIMLSIGQVMKV